jgi:hypothetical protein
VLVTCSLKQHTLLDNGPSGPGLENEHLGVFSNPSSPPTLQLLKKDYFPHANRCLQVPSATKTSGIFEIWFPIGSTVSFVYQMGLCPPLCTHHSVWGVVCNKYLLGKEYAIVPQRSGLRNSEQWAGSQQQWCGSVTITTLW